MAMRNREIVFMLAMLLMAISAYSVKVETTAHLTVFYPEYLKIDLICGQMPKVTDNSVEFCCEAAFTGELLAEFKQRITIFATE